MIAWHGLGIIFTCNVSTIWCYCGWNQTIWWFRSRCQLLMTFCTIYQKNPNTLVKINSEKESNYANPVYGVTTICHQVRWVRWGHPSLFHTATSLLIWYKMFCVRDISYRLIWMEFINMFSVYAQSGTHSRFNWWIIVVLTYNPSVLTCVEITDAPKL